MNTSINTRPSPLSLALVGAQFLLLALLLSPVRTLWPSSISDIPGTLCLLACLALALWAFVSLRLRNFTVTPEPRADAQLVTRGPYAWIRHPMYSAVLLAGLGAAVTRATMIDAIQCGLLVVVMFAKIQREEKLLLARYDDYDSYRARTAALIPGIY